MVQNTRASNRAKEVRALAISRGMRTRTKVKQAGTSSTTFKEAWTLGFVDVPA